MNFTDESLALLWLIKDTANKPNQVVVLAWTIETADKFVSLLYPGLHFAPGQEWKTLIDKYDFICPKHGLYEALATPFSEQLEWEVEEANVENVEASEGY